MRNSPDAKLNELRTKTDRQLAALISNRLDRGLAFARVWRGEEARQSWASTDHFRMNAERALSEASLWMRFLVAAAPPQRHRLEFKRTQLRDLLDNAPLRVRAAS